MANQKRRIFIPKEKKRRIKFILALVLMILVMINTIGCISAPPKKAIAVEAENTPVEAEIVTEVAVEDKEESSPAGTALIDEQLLFEQDDILVKAMSFTEDDIWGPEINLYIENNSNANVTISATQLAINDVMMDALLSVDVTAGKKANDAIYLSNDILDLANISTISDIQCKFLVYDSDSWEDIFETDLLEIKTNSSEVTNETSNEEIDDSGDVLFDEEDIKVVYKGLLDDSLLGVDLLFYMENNSDRTVTITSLDSSINGFMTESYLYVDILPAKKAIVTMSFFEEDLVANGIDSLEEVEFVINGYDAVSWDDIFYTDPIVIEF